MIDAAYGTSARGMKEQMIATKSARFLFIRGD